MYELGTKNEPNLAAAARLLQGLRVFSSSRASKKTFPKKVSLQGKKVSSPLNLN